MKIRKVKKEGIYLYHIKCYLFVVSIIFFVLAALFLVMGYNVKSSYDKSGANVNNQTEVSSKIENSSDYKVKANIDNQYITEKNIKLDKTLSNIDNKLEKTNKELSIYHRNMKKDDYNTQYLQYKKAFEDLFKMDKNIEYGSHYYDTARLFMGEDVYNLTIEEIKMKLKELSIYFSDSAVHAQTLFDKIIELENSGKLDGLGVHVKKDIDGNYDWEIPTDAFGSVAKELDWTEEMLTAFINSVGMLGEYEAYNSKEIADIVKNYGIFSKERKKTIVSVQGMESILQSLDVKGKDLHNTLDNICKMKNVISLDFNVESKNKIKSVLNKLQKLDIIDFDGINVDLVKFVTNLKYKLNMSNNQVKEIVLNYDGTVRFTESGKIIENLEKKLKNVLSGENKDGSKTQAKESYNAKDNMNNSEKNVEKDNYNYTNNDIYFTILGVGCLLSGIILIGFIIIITIKIKEYEEITIESVQKRNDKYIIYKRKIDKKS